MSSSKLHPVSFLTLLMKLASCGNLYRNPRDDYTFGRDGTRCAESLGELPVSESAAGESGRMIFDAHPGSDSQ